MDWGAFVLEKSTVIGLIMGVISIFVGMILKGAPLTALNNPAAFLIIIGGTFSCLFIGFRMEQLGNFVNLIKKTCQVPQLQEKGQLVQQFIELSQIARREGILALESKAQEIQDPFFRTGLGMVIDGMDPDFVGDVLDAELAIMQERHAEGRSMFTQAGRPLDRCGVCRDDSRYLYGICSLDAVREQAQDHVGAGSQSKAHDYRGDSLSPSG